MRSSEAEIDRRIEMAIAESVAIRATPDFAKVSPHFWKNASRAGRADELLRNRPCACATQRPTRWAWSITGTTMSYFEIGRVEYMRERGVAYKEMEERDDSYIVVAESHCRHLHPARYDDLLRIRTRVSQARRRTLRFAYEIRQRCTWRIAGNRRDFACRSAIATGRPKALPDKYRALFPLSENGGAEPGR